MIFFFRANSKEIRLQISLVIMSMHIRAIIFILVIMSMHIRAIIFILHTPYLVIKADRFNKFEGDSFSSDLDLAYLNPSIFNFFNGQL